MIRIKKEILLLILVCLLTGCKNNETDSLLISDYKLNIIQSNNCLDRRLYTTTDDKNIYLECINEVMLEKDEDKITLKQYLDSNNFSVFVEELENQVKPQVYKDGGTKIYKKNNLTVIVCKKMIDANNYIEDIYFGNSELTYDNTCK